MKCGMTDILLLKGVPNVIAEMAVEGWTAAKNRLLELPDYSCQSYFSCFIVAS